MYTLIKNNRIFFVKNAIETLWGWDPTVSEKQKAEIMTAVEDALKNDKDPQHEALKLAVQWWLDQYLNDPKIVLAMINYAQEHHKSALTVLAISKRFATLIGDTAYFSELWTIESSLIQDRKAIIDTNHIGINRIKETVQNKIRTVIS